MRTGAITGYIDVAQLTLYAFFIFFAGLVLYLRREDKREGYPLASDRSGQVTVQGFPPTPPAKQFLMPHGEGLRRSNPGERRPIAVLPTAPWPGAPMQPTGNPMQDGVGSASYAMRADEPDLAYDDGLPKIVPLRVAPDFFLATEDPDPRGMTVIGADRHAAGVVKDAWVDRSETVIRYVEVELDRSLGGGAVLLPMNFMQMDPKRRRIGVQSILANQFAGVPRLQNPDQVTLREEDKIMAYYGGGKLYAKASRLEPLL
jgi:photosynthetic reaction center H subunit